MNKQEQENNKTTSKRNSKQSCTIHDTRVYLINEVAELLKCSPPTVRKLIADEKLSARKVGRSFRVLGEAIKSFLMQAN